MAAVCVYCSVPLLVSRDATGHGTLSRDTDLDESEVETIKGLVAEGRRADAVALYQRSKQGATAQEAGEAIDGYTFNIVRRSTQQATMATRGFVFVGLSTVGVVGGIALAIRFPDVAMLGIIVSLIFALWLWILLPGFFRTIRYLSAAVGEATILRHAHIGQIAHVHSFLLHMRVAAADGSTFETEIALPVSEQRKHRIHDGRRMLVKYFPGQPDSVVYHGDVDGQ